MEVMDSPSLPGRSVVPPNMGIMDSPTDFFNECVPFGDVDPYPDAFDRDRGITYDQQRLKYYDKFYDSPAMRASKAQVPRSSGWDHLDTNETGAPDTGNQPMFVDPNLYANDSTIIGLPMQTGDTHSPSPESQPSSLRRPSSIKSEFYRESQSGSASTDLTPPDPPPQRKRRPRKSKRASNMPRDEEKRLKFLERNRLAASKCREKKKMFVSDLERTKMGLEADHTQLQLERAGLMREVGELKHKLMAHAKCGEPTIDSWLSNEARRFTQVPDLFAGYQLPPQQHPNHSHTRNHSTASSHQSLAFNTMGTGDRRDSIAFSPGKLRPSLVCDPKQVVPPKLT